MAKKSYISLEDGIKGQGIGVLDLRKERDGDIDWIENIRNLGTHDPIIFLPLLSASVGVSHLADVVHRKTQGFLEDDIKKNVAEAYLKFVDELYISVEHLIHPTIFVNPLIRLAMKKKIPVYFSSNEIAPGGIYEKRDELHNVVQLVEVKSFVRSQWFVCLERTLDNEPTKKIVTIDFKDFSEYLFKCEVEENDDTQ